MVTRRRKRPVAAWYEVRNCVYLRLCGGSGVALVLVTSKKKAIVVAGSTPPKYHTDVPLQPQHPHSHSHSHMENEGDNYEHKKCLPDADFVL